MHFQPPNSTFTFQSKTKSKKRNEKGLKSSKSKNERFEVAQGELIASVTTAHVKAEKKVFSAITSEFFINIISHSHSGNSSLVEGDSAAVLLKSVLNRSSTGAGGVESGNNNISLFTCGAIILSSLNACVVATSWNDLVIYSLSTDASLSTTATAAQERASFKVFLFDLHHLSLYTLAHYISTLLHIYISLVNLKMQITLSKCFYCRKTNYCSSTDLG